MVSIDLEKMSLRPKRTINIVFVGHVDSGKSTICGRILVDLKRIDERVLEKYKKQSKELNRASWYLSWCMDINPEERERGKTVEIGTASFDLENTRINVLDAPGHKQFVQEMIEAASRAEVGVLIVSARNGEFEVGMSGGQTKEHVILLKLGGVEHLVVLVNKMDEIGWDNNRYEHIKKKIIAFTQKNFESVTVIPICGMSGENLTMRHSWKFYEGPSFLEYLDKINIDDETIINNNENSIDSIKDKNVKDKISKTTDKNISVIDKTKYMLVIEKIRTSGSSYIYCKTNRGEFCVGETVCILPSGRIDTIVEIETESDIEVNTTIPGETYKIKLKSGIDEVLVGNKIVSNNNSNFRSCREMLAEILVIDPAKPITVGYVAMLHLGNQTVGAKITDMRTMEKKRALVAMKREKYIVKIVLDKLIVVEINEKKKEKFSLRDEAFTIASGTILKVSSKSK